MMQCFLGEQYAPACCSENRGDCQAISRAYHSSSPAFLSITFTLELWAQPLSDPFADLLFSRFLRARKFDLLKTKEMLLAAEQWRKDFGVDDIVKNFDFKEKAEVDKYYPQYYHKMDKVCSSPRPCFLTATDNVISRTAAHYMSKG